MAILFIRKQIKFFRSGLTQYLFDNMYFWFRNLSYLRFLTNKMECYFSEQQHCELSDLQTSQCALSGELL